MRLTLKDFQADGVARLRQLAMRAGDVVAEEGPQSLVLAAPTGSGKTVMAMAWMEQLIEGDEDHSPVTDATFLWLTDQPELNEQTRRKFEAGSTTFRARELVTIDAGFDADVFEPRSIFFLNTQKLGRNSNLVKPGDRGRTLWETIANTAVQRPSSFWVVIDEAHKGMAETPQERETANTIVQKFIKGSPDEIPAMPLILGISATPDRFTALLAGTERTTRPPVTVEADAVRASGLLKEAITLYHPNEAQPSDLTLLRAAAEQLRRYDQEWEAYSTKEKARSVLPVLVVQVEDGTAKTVTKTDVGACLGVIEQVLGPLNDLGVGHSFQEGHHVLVGDERRLRYVAPADIQDDTELRVIFFKRALTTGWDCPRAETMMSFRRAVDDTLIAQLVGRMVRTPLARSVSTNDFLNSVSLYLPYYNEKALDSVIERLTAPDPDIAFPTAVWRGDRLTTLKRNPAAEEAFEAAEQLVTYRVERVSKQSNIRRALRLGRLLAWDELDAEADDALTGSLVDTLEDERRKVADSDEFAQRLDDVATIDIRAVTVAYGWTKKTEITSAQLAAVTENIEHAFTDAGRKLGGGLHAAYLKRRAGDDEAPPVGAIKLELYALLLDGEVLKHVEADAGKLLSTRLEQHKTAIRKLPDERRQLYRQIRRQAVTPEPEPWELPDALEGLKDGRETYDKHLYIDDQGNYSATLNEWEDQVLRDVLKGADVIGWLRNEPRKQWSFTVSYEHGKQFKAMYPDFLVFRKQGVGTVCDILEPHSLSFEDGAAKAKGLAAFARAHGDEFGLIRLIAKVDGALKTLSLDDIETRDRVLAVATSDHLKLLFEDV